MVRRSFSFELEVAAEWKFVKMHIYANRSFRTPAVTFSVH